MYQHRDGCRWGERRMDLRIGGTVGDVAKHNGRCLVPRSFNRGFNIVGLHFLSVGTIVSGGGGMTWKERGRR